MDFYYRKLLGNGAIASKFRISSVVSPTFVQLKQLNLRSNKDNAPEPDEIAENSKTHHPNNCNRCYRLKKKCSREYPKCTTCSKTGSQCEYVIRSNKRRKRERPEDFKILTDKDFVVEKSEIISDKEKDAVEKSEIVSDKEKDIVENMFGGSDQERGQKSENADLTETIHHAKDSSTNLPTAAFATPFSSSDRGPGVPLIIPGLVPGVNSAEHHKLSVSLLVHRDETPADSTRSTENHLRALRRGPLRTIELLRKLLSSRAAANPRDELINLPQMPVELPSIYVQNFFENFAHKYPFLSRSTMRAKLAKTDFTQELIVDIDVYLVMSIGAILCGKKRFDAHFSERTIDGIIDVVNMDLRGASTSDVEESLKVLLLLAIYHLVAQNGVSAWNMCGVLSRVVVQLRLYAGNAPASLLRIVWSVHNLDAELLMLVKRPAQFPHAYNKCAVPTRALDDEESVELVALEIAYQKLCVHILDQNLRQNGEGLTVLLSALEKWRVQALLSIHRAYSQSALLQDATSVVNLNYYYMLVEMDQLSPVQLLQFVFHFFLNSFSLVILETEVGSKQTAKISVIQLFTWRAKLRTVLRYMMVLLGRLLVLADANLEASLKLNEFSSNLQLVVNLLKYVKENAGHDYGVDALLRLSVRLAGLNLLVGRREERESVAADVEEIRKGITEEI